MRRKTRTLSRGRVLEPFAVRQDTWFYAGSRFDIVKQLAPEEILRRTVIVKVPTRRLIEALEVLGFTVRPPRKAESRR